MFNPPPADLDRRDPLIYDASATTIWCRTHKAGYDPIFFGRNKAARWDAPNGDYGVLYLGADERCAFMESIGRSYLRTRLVPASELSRNLTDNPRDRNELHVEGRRLFGDPL